MALPAPRHPRSRLLTILVALNLPVVLFSMLLIWQQYSPDRAISHVTLGKFKALAWFAPVEDFCGPNFERPFFSLAPAGLAVLLALLAYLLSFTRRAQNRPIRQVLALHIEMALLMAVTFTQQFGLTTGWIPWVIYLAFLAGFPALAWTIERGAGKSLNAISNWCIRKELYGAGNSLLWFSLLISPGDRKQQRMLGLMCFETGDFPGCVDALEPLVEDGCADIRILTVLEECHRTDRDWEKALRMGRMLVDADPRHEEVRMRVARLMEELGRSAEAADLLRNGPPSSRMDYLELMLSNELKKGDIAAALETAQKIEDIETRGNTRGETAWRKILQTAPHQQVAMESLARLLMRNHRDDEAFALLEQIVHETPQRHDVRSRLIQHYQEKNLLDKAEPHLIALMDMGHANEEIALLYGSLLVQRDEFDRALLHFHYAVENYPRDYRFAYFLAQISYKTDALEDARRWCEDAGTRVQTPSEQLRVDRLKKRVEQAFANRDLQILQERRNRNPEDLEIRFQHLLALCAHGKAERAVAEFDDLLSKQPETLERVMTELDAHAQGENANFRLIDYLADLNVKQKRWDKVYELSCRLAEKSLQGNILLMERCESILSGNPMHAPSLRKLGELCREKKLWHKCLEYNKRLLTLDRTAALEPLKAMFDAAVELGEDERAIEIGNELCKEFPREMRYRIKLVQLLADLDRYEEAFEHLTSAQSMDYYNPDIVKAMREIGERRKTYRLKTLIAVLQKNPGDSAALMEAGELYMDSGDLRKAIASFQRAMYDKTIKNRAGAKLAHALAQMRQMDLAEETMDEVEMRTGDPAEDAVTKNCCFEVAEIFLQEEINDKALKFYKKVFRVDSTYRNVVDKISALS